MKKAVGAVLIASTLACTSVETAVVSRDDVVATGGDAVAVIQGTAIGFSLLFHTVDVVPADLDVVVNKLLVSEAKAMGASKVDLKEAYSLPRHGIFHVLNCPAVIICPTSANASGIAVK